jgi:hypothetical protein
VIFPPSYKEVGYAATTPCGKKTYFLSKYLIHRSGDRHEVLKVTLDQEEQGLLRTIRHAEVLAPADDVYWFPEKVQLFNRRNLVELALASGHRCTIFTGLDEHINFVIDPDLSSFLTIHIYDVIPPRPSLSAAIEELDRIGLFGELELKFEHHIRDISKIDAEVFPCRAAGFTKTLDADEMHGGERIAGCLTGSQLYRQCYGEDFILENISSFLHRELFPRNELAGLLEQDREHEHGLVLDLEAEASFSQLRDKFQIE